MIHESACLLVIALSVLHSSLWASVILLVSNRAQLSLEMNFRINYHEATVPLNHLTNATDTPDTPMASTRFTTHVASSPSVPEESYPSHRRGDDVTDNSRAPPSLTTALLPSSNRHPVALTGGSPGGAQGRYVRRHLRINSHSGTPNDTNSHPLENFEEVEHEDMGRPLSPSSPASLTSPSSQPSSPTEDEFPPAIDLSESASTFNLNASRSSAQIFLSPLMTAGSVEDSVYLRLGMMSLSLLHVSESLLALYCDKNYVSQSILLDFVWMKNCIVIFHSLLLQLLFLWFCFYLTDFIRIWLVYPPPLHPLIVHKLYRDMCCTYVWNNRKSYICIVFFFYNILYYIVFARKYDLAFSDWLWLFIIIIRSDGATFLSVSLVSFFSGACIILLFIHHFYPYDMNIIIILYVIEGISSYCTLDAVCVEAYVTVLCGLMWF